MEEILIFKNFILQYNKNPYLKTKSFDSNCSYFMYFTATIEAMEGKLAKFILKSLPTHVFCSCWCYYFSLL